jgi:HEPN domain-containing protein
MSVPPELIHVIQNWVEKAEGDLVAARQVLKLKKNCPFHVACFLAQQCAEKYLKALLTLQATAFPKTHDLSELFTLLGPGTHLEVKKTDLIIISRHAVDARYPGESDPLTRSDAERAVKIAAVIRKAVRQKLPRPALTFGNKGRS